LLTKYEQGASKTIGEKNNQPIDKHADGRNQINSEGWLQMTLSPRPAVVDYDIAALAKCCSDLHGMDAQDGPTGSAGCCARAASGHAATAPLSVAKNFRRAMRLAM
jgi:hypothetical protein